MKYNILYEVSYFNLSVINYLAMFTSVILLFILLRYGKNIKSRSKTAMCFLILICIFTTITSTLSQFNKVHQLRTGDCNIVEGKTYDFTSSKNQPKGHESFFVNDIYFTYSSFYETDGGFNKTNSVGGSMHEGMQVRIHYNKDGMILKLESK